MYLPAQFFANQIAFQSKPTPLFFTCLTSWLTELEIAKVTTSPLVALSFRSLFSNDSALRDAAINFIIAMFRETRKGCDHTESIKVLYDQLLDVGTKMSMAGTDPNVFSGFVRMY